MAPARILAVGGGTQNPLWMRIVSDIAGITQHVPALQIGASYGDALLAGVGIGLFADTAHAGRSVKIDRVLQPDPNGCRLYDEYYKVYRELYDRTAAIAHSLSLAARGPFVE